MKPALVIVGLGNPGDQYKRTRHNAGFMAIDKLSDEFGEGEWEDKQKFQSYIQEARVGVVPVLLVKPKTYMNLSGDAVRKIVDFFKLDVANQILICVDDIDLPLADLRMRKSGGPGTHNGMKSLVDTFGEGFPRLRIGLGTPPTGGDLSGWVLSAMKKEEEKALQESFDTLSGLVSDFVLGSS